MQFGRALHAAGHAGVIGAPPLVVSQAARRPHPDLTCLPDAQTDPVVGLHRRVDRG